MERCNGKENILVGRDARKAHRKKGNGTRRTRNQATIRNGDKDIGGLAN
jgi:hypothetical protein